MNINKTIVLLLLITFITTNVSANEANFETKTIGHSYRISFPNYMSRTYGLNQAASAQYMNSEKEAYTIVIDDEKEEMKLVGAEINNLDEYYDFFMSSFNIDSLEIITKKNIKINKLDAIQLEITGFIEEIKIYYFITFVDSKKYFYNILSWTLDAHKNDLINDFKKIASSLKD